MQSRLGGGRAMHRDRAEVCSSATRPTCGARRDRVTERRQGPAVPDRRRAGAGPAGRNGRLWLEREGRYDESSFEGRDSKGGARPGCLCKCPLSRTLLALSAACGAGGHVRPQRPAWVENRRAAARSERCTVCAIDGLPGTTTPRRATATPGAACASSLPDVTVARMAAALAARD